MAPTRAPAVDRGPRRSGFTLPELLVVVAIIAIVSAAVVPLAISALNELRINEASRTFQARLVSVRSAAMRDGLPRGFRLIPSEFANGGADGRLAYDRIVPIQSAPPYRSGQAAPFPILNQRGFASANPGAYFDFASSQFNFLVLVQVPSQLFFTPTGAPIPFPISPTGWYWNVRVGDQVEIGDSGYRYTVVGPVEQYNSELFVNAALGRVGFDPLGTGNPQLAVEVLYLVNNRDDNGDGFADNGVDGVDNDGISGSGWVRNDMRLTPPMEGNTPSTVLIDNVGENNEVEQWLDLASFTRKFDPADALTPSSTIPADGILGFDYTLYRRPVRSTDGAEFTLPGSVVIDATTWNSTRERSRLPIDPLTGYVDILFAPNGTIQTGGRTGGQQESVGTPYYHFWLTELEGVVSPFWITTAADTPQAFLDGNGINYLLPMPSGITGYGGGVDGFSFLEGQRRLVTLSPQTGRVETTDLENFDASSSVSGRLGNVNAPYLPAELGLGSTP